MSSFLQLAFVLAIIILAAKLGGYLSTRIGQPSVFGELLVGLLLGPSLIDLTHLSFITDIHLGETISQLGELGVLLLMFLAGLELDLRDLMGSSKVSAFSGTLGVILPVGLGLLAGELTGMNFHHAVFLGLTLGATSVSISAQTLMEMKVLRSRVGLGLLGAAVFDDILVILLLSFYLALQGDGSGFLAILLVIGKMILFFALSIAFGVWLLPRLMRQTARLNISQGVISLAIVILLFYGLAAEIIGGMAAITGTFLAGLMFSRTPESDEIKGGLHALAYSFFVPVFFIGIGLSVNVKELDPSALWITLMIILIAILGKTLGAGLGAYLGRFSMLESLQLGIGMVSRGEVGLIVAKVGLDQGLLSPALFSAIVGMVLVTTLVTPPMLRAAFRVPKPPPAVTEPEG
ncbi:Kef-type K+ transport systems, membrane components [Longilinea arvoryzae]|uniref:Kef-type K+ transport systems, membrane components n=1 Tax=Longilinea arvoryzae TaxID=360412 RepID=A0A0S7BF94_9CHLR|nr:cation:proton antiporter [Longilinea arvoryzae]GAP14169.1 Kef-type K+ transport systems, membrane components [Longilinea arvoryzae]